MNTSVVAIDYRTVVIAAVAAGAVDVVVVDSR